MSATTATTAFRAARDSLLARRTDYETAIVGFDWPDVGPRFNWASDWFDVVARDNDRTALWLVEEDGSEQKITYREMAARSDAAAAWLRAQGVNRGDRVLLMLGNQVELWELMLAIIKLGAVIMPTTTVLGPHELVDRVVRGEVRHVIANAEDAPKFQDVPGDYGRISVGEVPGWAHYAEANASSALASPPDGDRWCDTEASDPVLIYFTSGTTSKPKMVEHSQVSYPVGHLATMYWLGVQPGDVHLAISSPGWGKHAWSCFFAPWIAEATVFVYNYTKFDPVALEEQLVRAQVNTFCAPPTVWRMLIQMTETRGPGAMRELLSAGEPLNPEVIAQIQRMWGLPIRDGYGQTETTALIANTPGSPIKAGSMGRPLPGAAVVLLDTRTGQPAPDGPVEEGEICLDLARHPVNLMTGYVADEQRDAQAREGGYFHTGDVASRDENGLISYIGRTDDVFKSSDFKVSPFEVESILIEHPAVAEAAVVPAPDPVRQTIPKAYVALTAGWEPGRETARAVLQHCRENLPPYMRIRRVEFAELPKTISGKIRRVELRQRENEAAEAGIIVEGEWREDHFPDLKKPVR
ncbi:AMP-binding protein [Klugiella xanthotipulae]|uniref:Acetyl-CoA synthetase n=1 Tax=Klugiella xanthotipulae TaxID=244735 RepID=A0A543HXH0_9MICO|nr:AMP-binding protein [Klugiella xanthotipulae]TQM63058.1 acetyl-CoA synthetase [Klugiella xanthotipulae]